jgi:chitosanase
MSGNLGSLIEDYIMSGGEYVAALAPYLEQLKAKSVAPDNDKSLQTILTSAGSDPIMQTCQDRFFDANFWAPSVKIAESYGFVTPLSYAVIYDGHIQGSFSTIVDITEHQLEESPSSANEKQWVAAYVSNRSDWLQSEGGLLATTTYRMDAFDALMHDNNWELALPFTVRGVTLTQDRLTKVPAVFTRTLYYTNPAMIGEDIKLLQSTLISLMSDVNLTTTGHFDQLTESAVRAFQASKGLTVDGTVGPVTLAALNLTGK